MIGALLLAAAAVAPPDTVSVSPAEQVPPARVEAISRIGYGDPRLRPPGLRPPSVALTLHAPGPVAGVGFSGSLLRARALSRSETTLKGAGMAANTAMFLGALSSNWGWWDERASWWMVGGAAAAGALWGSTLGYESKSFSVDVRVGDD